MESAAGITTQQPKGIAPKIPIILTDTSAILGLLMLIMSFAYLFIAVSVTKESTKLNRKCACTGNPNSTQVLMCRSRTNVPLADSNPDQAASIKKDEMNERKAKDRFCKNLAQEYGAGALGIIFGLFQTVTACVFLLAGVPDALKLVWIIVHAVIALVCIIIVLLVFDVMLYKFLNRGLLLTSIYFPDAFLHDGSPASVKRGNTVVFVYWTFVLLDAIGAIVGIVLMVVTKPASRVGSKAVVPLALKESGPEVDAVGAQT